ncbi:MAG TPA: hypothetical protein VE201_04845 [Nitrospirales bacterium]|nr:hypothetical protein [Nitrospirales bacterium]
MRHGVCLAVATMLTLAVVGCGGPGQTIPLSVNMDAVPAPEKVTTPLRVAVVPFEDVRSDKSKVGRYQHYVESTVDTLVPAGVSAADQITNFVVEYLKRAGFQVTRVQPGQTVPPGPADVVLSGQIESYWSEAVTRFARTELAAKNRLVLKAANVGDGSIVRTTVEGEGTVTVVFFDLEDLEKLNSEALGQTLARFLADVVVTDRALKPKK